MSFESNQVDYRHTLDIIEKYEKEEFHVEVNEDLLSTGHYQYKWSCFVLGNKEMIEGPVRSSPYPAFAPCVIAFRAYQKLDRAETLTDLDKLIKKIRKPVPTKT